jgi:putative membrane protein
MNFLLRIIITAVVAFGLSSVMRGIHIDTFWTAIVLSIVLAVLNMLVKPLLIILTIPITILTFGLFLLVINAGIILLAGSLVNGFRVDGFWWALLFSLLLSMLTSLLYGRDREEEGRRRH